MSLHNTLKIAALKVGSVATSDSWPSNWWSSSLPPVEVNTQSVMHGVGKWTNRMG